MNPYQLWKISTIMFFIFLTFLVVAIEKFAALHGDLDMIKSAEQHDLNNEGNLQANRFKQFAGIFMVSLLVLIWVNPTRLIYRRVRYSTIIAFYNILIAPFGLVNFKAYILAEILTDCIIPLEDFGKVITHLILGDWNSNFTSKA